MIYLDSNASSRLRPAADAAVRRYLEQSREFGNPSSVHQAGRVVRAELRQARRDIERLLSLGSECQGQLIFTSGGTEACNFMLSAFCGVGSGHIVASAIEHPAVLEKLRALEEGSWEITLVRPDHFGFVEVDEMLRAVNEQTALVCLMVANNETGAIQDVALLARKLREENFQGAIVSDMTQALGKSQVSAADLFHCGVTAVAISGHKIGGPSGIGALYFNKSDAQACHRLSPLLVGGPQEQRLRAGTENIIGALGFAAAAGEVYDSLELDIAKRRHLSRLFWELISRRLSDLRLLSSLSEAKLDLARALSNTLLISFAGCRGDDLVAAFDIAGLAASTGAACASGKQDVSHAVEAMGLEESVVRSVVRFSLDWDIEESSIVQAAEIVSVAVERMRSCSNI